MKSNSVRINDKTFKQVEAIAKSKHWTKQYVVEKAVEELEKGLKMAQI